MKDTMKILRAAIDAILKGAISYNGGFLLFFDEKVFVGQMPNVYCLYSTQREQDASDQYGSDCTFVTRSTIDLMIVDRTGSEVSKDILDDLSNLIMELLLNSPGNSNLAVPAGFQISYLKRDSAVSGLFQITPTQSEIRKIMTFSAIITQTN